MPSAFFHSDYIHERAKDKPLCIVDCGCASGDPTANVDYQYNEIHYHVDVHLPANMDAEQLKEVLLAIRHPEQLPEEINTPIIEKHKTIKQKIHEKMRLKKNDEM